VGEDVRGGTGSHGSCDGAGRRSPRAAAASRVQTAEARFGQTRTGDPVAVPVNPVSPSGRRGFLYRWRWPLALAAVTVTALVIPWLAASGPRAVVYQTTDFAGLPTMSGPPAGAQSCASIRHVDGSARLVDEACGSPASTFRVIGRVADAAQCVRDADLTYSWSAGAKSGTACLDYDWAADQCLHIGSNAVSKVNCADHGAVRPQMAIIGAVDVSYCLEGGIAHRVRHFTVCTLAGDKDCKGRTHGI
jgi:hypothetical protein